MVGSDTEMGILWLKNSDWLYKKTRNFRNYSFINLLKCVQINFNFELL